MMVNVDNKIDKILNNGQSIVKDNQFKAIPKPIDHLTTTDFYREMINIFRKFSITLLFMSLTKTSPMRSQELIVSMVF